VVSVDPLYAFGAGPISRRIAATCKTVLAQARENRDDYVWEVIPSVEELGRFRLATMETFLADFAAGRGAGRYVAGALPSLPFTGGSFDLALCSHLLFLYSGQFSTEFHLQALREMLRVAREVRVFPLLTLDGKPSPHVAPVIAALTGEGVGVERRRVPYEFQRGDNEMLVIGSG
jgi:SAM-dependent methyltransferase